MTFCRKLWKEVAGQVQCETNTASNGVKVGVPIQTKGGSASGYDATGNANVSWQTNRWVNLSSVDEAAINDGNPNTDINTPYRVDAYPEGNETWPGWKAFNINTSSGYLAPSGYSAWKIKIDYATQKTVAGYKILGHTSAGAYSPGAWTLEGSSSGSFSGEQTIVDTRSGETFGTSLSPLYTCSNPGAYRYYRLNISDCQGQSQPMVMELYMYGGSYASSSNKVTSTDLIGGGSALAFDPSLAVFKTLSSGGTDITTDCMIEYSIDNKSNWSSQYTVAQFKALAKSIFVSCSYLHLRFQLTGSQTLGYVTMTTDATSVLLAQVGNLIMTGDINIDDAVMTGDLTMDTTKTTIAQVTTTDATATVIKSIPVAADKTVSIDVDVIGNKASTATKATYRLVGSFLRNGTGNVTANGTTTNVKTEETDGDWAVDLVANTTAQSIDVTVTGKADTTIAWSAKITYNIA